MENKPAPRKRLMFNSGWKLARACGMVGRACAGATELKVTLADIEAAHRVVADVVLRTPMLPAPKLSALTGAEVYVKYENLQVTNSFKDRGALVKLASLSEGRTQTRRYRDVGRQSCPGGRLSCRAVGNPGVNCNAGNDAIRESGRDTIVWRRSCAARRNRGGSGGALRTNSGPTRPGSGSPLRRSGHHCRPGHDRARNARRGAAA